MKLEICCFNIQSALIAQQMGASRIELCNSPAEGGTTPSLSTVEIARNHLRLDLFPIIRPREGDFLYSEEEYQIMKSDIMYCKKAGCDGVVIGLLNPDGSIDKSRVSRLVEIAYPMEVTFHRAFDWCANPFEAMEDIITTGCTRLLSSGQKPTAPEGAQLLKELVRQAEDRIVVMPGSGIRSSNLSGIIEITGAEEFHSSARVLHKSRMEFLNDAMLEELSYWLADAGEVEAMATQLSPKEP
jgi:copper homeostasis protein